MIFLLYDTDIIGTITMILMLYDADIDGFTNEFTVAS